MDKAFTESYKTITVYAQKEVADGSVKDKTIYKNRPVQFFYHAPGSETLPQISKRGFTCVPATLADGIALRNPESKEFENNATPFVGVKLPPIEVALVSGGGKVLVEAGTGGITAGQYVYAITDTAGGGAENFRCTSSATFVVSSAANFSQSIIGYALSTATAGNLAQVLLAPIGRF